MSDYKEILVQSFGTIGRGWIEVIGVMPDSSFKLLWKTTYGYKNRSWEVGKRTAEAKVQEFKSKYNVTSLGNYELLD
jgi:hypothetical protein